MLSGLDAIYEELQRLKLEGVKHVFVADTTLQDIEPVRPARSEAGEAENRPAVTTGRAHAPASGADLASMIASTETSPPKPHPKPETRKNDGPSAPLELKPLPKAAPIIELPDGDAAMQLEWLRQRVEACVTCREYLQPGGRIVFGSGAVDADIFFCGEAPGEQEALSGESFVGNAGELLTKIIGAMGLSREAVYIANILKWRPEHDKPYGNRPPTLEEMRFCLPYLKAQITIVRPKVIVALGNTAVSGLLGHDPKRKMGQIRGTWQQFGGIDTMVTFHPSYLLRSDTRKTKRMVWEDMLEVMGRVGLPISEKQKGFFLPK